MEYLISSEPLEQISCAVPLVKSGETCLSSQAWAYARDSVIEGPLIEERAECHLLLRMDESSYTSLRSVRRSIVRHPRGEHVQDFGAGECSSLHPLFVYKQIESGNLQYVNEMRTISVIFVLGSGLVVTSPNGPLPLQAQTLMPSVQSACYAHEGTLNKFLVDDKGLLFLLVFGLPPLVHPDDPTRAVLASAEFVQIFKRLELMGRFGVTTGRSYCGISGSPKRMEYTVLGDVVDLSARLIAKAPCSVSCATRRRGGAQRVRLSSIGSIRSKSRARPAQWQFRAAAPASFGVHLRIQEFMAARDSAML